ncbi:MAG TPA: patatin-like phospholipase family protein [Bacillota bacterium]|nr:patatin-like phospholipase family protein [Bacillota bacterium]HOI37625.1 patatin-like phospholipase family protein [Bacillota bacterium]HPU76233.1 patatin-like phospholipase family protein [Bacillota bacterium]
MGLITAGQSLVATPVEALKTRLTATQRRLRARMDGVKRPTVGLALGSGAARGLAHIGVLEVLFSSRIPVDVIVGCSMGAVIGGCYAAGMAASELLEIGMSIDRREVFRHIDLTVPNRGGLISGTKMDALLEELTRGKTFEELRLPFACTAADINTGEEVVIEDGPIHKGIRASSSIPGVLQPVMHAGRALVDGGILNPIPANYLAALGVDVSIAVDVMPVLKPSPEQLGKAPSIVSTLINSFDIMGRLVAAPVACMATVVIRPQVGEVFGAEFWRGPELITEGFRAAEAAVPAIREALDSGRT